MIKTTAIDLINPESMMITWDTGRRCNYDCSYCEATRHDNHSAHPSLDSLITTYNFIERWADLYNNKRQDPITPAINFTGGEPTVNPNFWNLVDKIKSTNKFRLSLTTNGAWSDKHQNKIINNFSGVTISYHAEAHESLRKQVLRNILSLHENKIWLQVNLMLHVDHWDHCIEVYEYLKSHNISVKPRPIGDGNISRSGWFIDSDGSQRRTSHSYTQLQQEWFWKEMGVEKKAESSNEGTELGRGCCGGRCLSGKVNDSWQSIKLVDNKFNNWLCTVDWFFLHIDQATGLIYHHQTCQAKHDGGIGPIGHISQANELIEDLRVRLVDPKPIICPNQKCGCGMCVPKAKHRDDFIPMWNRLVRI